MKKKIILISYRLGYNNLLYWDNLLTSIKKQHPEFRVFTATAKLKSKDSSIETEQVLKGFKIHYKKTKKEGFLFYLPLPFFIYRITKYRPNLIILNEFNLNSFFVLLFKFMLPNTKILLLVESDPFLGHKNKHSKLRNLIRRYIANNADKILTNNKLGFVYLTDFLIVKHHKILVAPYLVSEPPSIKLLSKSENKEKIKFLFVGQIIQRKGLIYVLKAISMLDLADQNKIQFDIIGTGDEIDVLQQFTKENNLFSVNFLGFIEYEKISKYYSDADCFIMNSLHDYRALVGFEALQAGCAIIGSANDGARFEVIHEGKNGFINEPKNIYDIRDKISLLINDQKLLNIFKKYSKDISVNYSVKKGSDNFLKAINQL